MRRFPVCLLAASCVFASAAFAQTKVIFVGHLRFSADVVLKTYLETRYGKANVTFVDAASGTTKNTIKGYDVCVLSSTPSSGQYRNKFHDSTTPIVNMEEAMARNLNGEFRITAGRTKEVETGAHAITIRTAHPITAGFTVNQKVTITTGAAQVWWSTGTQAAGAMSLATDDDTATNLYLTIVDAGGTLLNNSKAPCRRVMFGMTDATFNFFTADGKKLFGQCVDWAAGACCAQANNYGTGLSGKNGIPTLTTSGPPVFLTTVNVNASNSSGVATPGLLLVGQLPLSFPFLGGTLLVTPFFEAYLTVPSGGLVLPLAVPNLAPLCGVSPKNLLFYAQVLQLDTAAAQGVSFSPGMRLKFGK